MYGLQIFNSPDFGDIRTVMIDGEPWFVSVDVSKALGYSKTASMTKLVDNDDKKNISSTDLEEQVYKQNYTIGIINESGLYAAIFGSKQENAKKFKKWVTGEVLPSIRKTGSFGKPQLPENPMELLELHYQALKEVDSKVDKAEERITALDKKLETALLELPLLGVESDKVDKALKQRGVEVVGGKESNAYHDKRLLKRVYWDIHGQLRREFQVGTYKAIKRNQTDLALKFLSEYQLPLALREEVETANAQQRLDV